MEIGNRIRFYRIQKNMTQEELAKGIISTSYLSKIENNQTQPSGEVLSYLSKRLDIQLIEQEEITLMEDLFKWYEDIIHYRKNEVESQYELLKDRINFSNDTTALIFFTLFELRYFFFAGKHEYLDRSLEKINLYSDILEDKMIYFFYKFKGMYHYVNRQYIKALDHLKYAEEHISNQMAFESWEKADLFYMIGLCLNQMRKPALSIQYTNSALLIFRSVYNLRRCGEAQVLLGLNFQRVNEFKKAYENYQLALVIAKQLDETDLLGIIYHNIGYYHFNQLEYEKALTNFNLALQYKKIEREESMLVTMYWIMQTFYFQDNKDQVALWLEKGEELLKRYPRKDFEYRFKVFRFLMEEILDEVFEKFLEKEVIPYFKDQNYEDEVILFSKFLAVHFENQNKYKAACHYYRMVINAVNEQNNRTNAYDRIIQLHANKIKAKSQKVITKV
ncbi:helix-turn-helix transcriptional regulator [Bacillus carboniphilus]|uniref:Helix-turn-helix transcriptional regulator n=1 Tax=Bacillus carboniphilus TaxID=86663 RepID=A0ABY9JWD8_9BACI|nr:helix-turn-helix transcriptional regulator [Bacillus carboniphilus]WLR43088.1 helix-turn-helix transcriptional regulator [Bacillus carboniphilus]